MSKETESDLFLIAIDDGHNETDATWEGPDGQMRLLRFESSARAGAQALMSFQGDSLSAVYDTEGQSFTCGSRRLLGGGLDTRTPDYPLSPLNRVLVAHAMRQADVPEGARVALATGLPLKEWMSSNREDRKQAKMRNIECPVVSRDGWNRPAIVWQDVYPEAVSAYVYGKVSGALPDGNIAVVDIGGRTTDVAIIIVDDEGRPAGIDVEHSGSEEMGVLQIRDRLGQLLSRDLKMDVVDDRTIDQVFVHGTAMIYGKEGNFEALRQEAMRDVRSSILNAVRRRLGGGTNFAAVWVVGGGARIMDVREGCPAEWHVVISDEPEYANVRGMYLRMRDSLRDVGISQKQKPVKNMTSHTGKSGDRSVGDSVNGHSET